MAEDLIRFSLRQFIKLLNDSDLIKPEYGINEDELVFLGFNVFSDAVIKLDSDRQLMEDKNKDLKRRIYELIEKNVKKNVRKNVEKNVKTVAVSSLEAQTAPLVADDDVQTSQNSLPEAEIAPIVNDEDVQPLDTSHGSQSTIEYELQDTDLSKIDDVSMEDLEVGGDTQVEEAAVVAFEQDRSRRSFYFMAHLPFTNSVCYWCWSKCQFPAHLRQHELVQTLLKLNNNCAMANIIQCPFNCGYTNTVKRMPIHMASCENDELHREPRQFQVAKCRDNDRVYSTKNFKEELDRSYGDIIKFFADNCMRIPVPGECPFEVEGCCNGEHVKFTISQPDLGL